MGNRGQAGAAPQAISVIDTGIRRHIAGVTDHLLASFAVTALAAAATGFALPSALTQSNFWWIASVAAPLILALVLAYYRRRRRERLLSERDLKTTLRLLYALAALIGVASAAAFVGGPRGASARVYLAVALAFAVASIWGRAVRRDFSPLVERFIVAELVLLVGLAIAQIIEIIAWPEGIEYFKYAINLRQSLPDEATSGSMEWVASLAVLGYFSFALAYYARQLGNRDFTAMNEEDMRFAAAWGAYEIYASVFRLPLVLLQVSRIFST